MEDNIKDPKIFWKDNACFMDNGIKIRKIGEIKEGIYFTPKNPNIHFYRNGKGYPLDVQTIDELMKRGVTIIIIQTYRNDETTNARIPIEVRQFSVSEYNAAKKFRQVRNGISYGWQKCVDWDRPLPEGEVQSTLYALFSLDDFYKQAPYF